MNRGKKYYRVYDNGTLVAVVSSKEASERFGIAKRLISVCWDKGWLLCERYWLIWEDDPLWDEWNKIIRTILNQ